MSSPVTRGLRFWGAVLWSTGFGIAAFDLLSINAFGWRAPISYIFFWSAAVLCYLAEKREFGARVVLYRLHDLAILSSWKYLFLYFLWISLLSGFTERSLVYGLTGWFSLIAVGFTAHFLFCERDNEQVFLLPKRLRIAFWVYSCSLILLFGNHVAHFLFPAGKIALIHRDPVSFFLYFAIGLPFLIWDFWNTRRHILPQAVSGTVMALGTASLLFSERMLFLLSLGFCTVSVLLFALYKRFRLKRFVFSVVTIGIISAALFYLLFLQNQPIEEIRALADYYQMRLTSDLLGAWIALKGSHFLGTGVGVTELRGVWVRVAAESGVVGLAFYSMFFLSLVGHLIFVRRSKRVVVSNIALVSVAYFLGFGALHVENPYGAYILCWYALWSVFAVTARKREGAL